MSGAARDGSRIDVGLACAILAGVSLYLAAFPLVMGPPDEPHYLHEAKRVLAGEVLYRDIFELTTPGWVYLMAGLFRLFGTTLHTARVTAAVLYGCSAALVFVACRLLGVRRALAVGTAVAALVIAHPAYPIASQHWLGTTLSLLLLAVCLDLRGRPLRAAAAGVVAGLLIAVHQQRGVCLGAAVVAIVIVDHLFRRNTGDGARQLLVNLAAVAAGAVLIVLPLGIFMVASAGPSPVWEALVDFPLNNYPFAPPWGHWYGRAPAGVFPRLLKYLPAGMVLALVSPLVITWRSGDREPTRAALGLGVFCVFSILSVLYNPDFIHIAFIAPVLLVAAISGVEWTLRLLPPRADSALGWSAAVLLLGAGAWRLERNFPRLPPNTVIYQSAFGPIPMARGTARLYDHLDGVLDAVPSRTFYQHPLSWYAYLILDTHNPTRFEFLLPNYHRQSQQDEVIAALRSGQVPYVVINPKLATADDPVVVFVRGHFELAWDAGKFGVELWRYKSDGAAAS